MGGHIEDEPFVGDRYAVTRAADGNDATADQPVLSFHDADPRAPLMPFAAQTHDLELGRDVRTRLRAIEAAEDAKEEGR